jgi:cytochrome c oxidase subunit 4
MSTTTEPAGPEPTGVDPSGPSTPDQHGAPHSEGIDPAHGHPGAMVTAAVHDEHKSTSYYVVVALVLAGLTALETSTYWVDFGPLMMPALLIMMTIKFFMVVLLFMHLKFDNRLFGVLFYSGLALAVFVYIAALMTFEFFNP